MRLNRLWLIVGLVVAALALAANGSSGRQRASAGGSLTFGAEQGGGPDWCLNSTMSVDCGEFWNVVYETPVLRSAFVLTPKFTYKLDLISKYTVQQNPQRITLYIRKNAKWSDGVPVTGKDFRFLWQTIMNPAYKDHVDTTGWRQVRTVTGNGKVVKIIFRTPFADWKDLLIAGAAPVLPQHVLQGTNQTTVWNTCICDPKTGKPIGDGPFLLTKYDPSGGITLQKNPAGWYGKPAKLSTIQFVYLTNTNTEIEQIRGREIDVIYPQPQQSLSDLKGQSGLRIQSSLGTTWEHIDIQQGPQGNPVAKQQWARQALTLSLDRAATVKALFGQLNSGLKPLNNLFYFPNQGKAYVPHWSKWSYNPTKAESLMKAHGCTKGGDGYYRCTIGGTSTKMTFSFESTRGNRLRELAFTFLQDQAKKAGIELVNNFKPAGTVFGSDLPNHTFDLAMYAFVSTADPGGRVPTYKCGGASNFGLYCNPKTSKMLLQTDKILVPTKRTALFEKIDSIFSNEIPAIPLYQKPTFLVYKSGIKGLVDNPNSQGPTWNVENWSK